MASSRPRSPSTSAIRIRWWKRSCANAQGRDRQCDSLGTNDNRNENASIDHLGIAVKSLAAAKAIYEKLGLIVSPEETVEQEQVRLVMVPVGESRLELLEATSESSTIAKFIAKRGEGLHHVCLRVPDLQAAVDRLKKRRCAPCVGRDQDGRWRAPVRVCSSGEHRRSLIRVGRGLATKAATDSH